MHGPRWYAAHTQPQAELRAAHRLQAQGYEVFAPTVARRVRHARSVKMVRRPLFPRYLFVRFDCAMDRWRCINGTAGIVQLVAAADQPLALPAGLVEALIEHHNWSTGQGDDAFHVGESARFTSGPFSDLVGRISSIDEKGRVELLLSLMGRSVAVITSVEQLSHLTPWNA